MTWTGPNRDEIWARGFRNPFRMSFDPEPAICISETKATTHPPRIERRNRWRAGSPTGLNFDGRSAKVPDDGWNDEPDLELSTRRSRLLHNGRFRLPRRKFWIRLSGSYFYGDYVQNWIKRLTFDASGNVTSNLNFVPPNGLADGPYGEIVDLKQGPDGALYYVDIGITWEGVPNPGTIRRIRNTAGNLPADHRIRSPTIRHRGQRLR